MLSAIVGGGVSRAQQLPTPEAASLLLAQELCIGLRSRRVTRLSVQSRPPQPENGPPAHRPGERARQLSISEAASLLLSQELQGRRVTRMSVQSLPSDPEAVPRIRTHALKSSGRTVRKLNYRKVANRGLVGSPDVGATRRNARPKSREVAAEGSDQAWLESGVKREVEASAKLSREVGLVRRKRAGAVGKSPSTVRRSKPRSVAKPGSNQAGSEAGPETWSSTITDIKLKVELPEARIQTGENPVALATNLCSGDDSSCGAALSVAGYESAEGYRRAEVPTVMDNCERGVPTAHVHQHETKCSYLLCRSVKHSASNDRLFSALANEMCTENGASGDVSEGNMGTKVPKCAMKLPATPVKHIEGEKATGLRAETESAGEALAENNLVGVPLYAAAAEKPTEVELVQEVPLEDVVTSDVPDQIPSAATVTNHLLAENEVANEVPIGGAAAIRTFAENGLAEVPSEKSTVELPVEGEVTSDPLAESQLACDTLGEVISKCVACANLGEDQLADVPIETVPSELTAEYAVAKGMLFEIAITNGAVQDTLTEVPSGTTEAMDTAAEGEVITAVPVENVRTSGTLVENQLAIEVFAGEVTTSEFVIFEFLAEYKLTDVPTDTTPSQLTTDDMTKAVPLGVAATMEMSADSGLPNEFHTDTTVGVFAESRLPNELHPESAVEMSAGLPNEVHPDTTMEVSENSELPPDTAMAMSADSRLPKEDPVERVMSNFMGENELAEVPTDITAATMEAFAVDELTMEVPVEDVAADGGLTENELADIPTDTTAAAMEVYRARELAIEIGVTTGSAFAKEQLAGEALAEVETTAESVIFEVLADGELVDITTDIVVTKLATVVDVDEAKPLEVATTKGMFAANGLFVLSPDTITKEMSAIDWLANAVPSHHITTSRVFSENELVAFSPRSLAPIEEEKVREVPVEVVMTSSILEENGSMKPPPDIASMGMATNGEVTAALTNDNAGDEVMAALTNDNAGDAVMAALTNDHAEGYPTAPTNDHAEDEPTVARNAIEEGIKGTVKSKVSDEISGINTFQNKQSESLTSKRGNVCAENDAMCCEDNGHRAAESNNSELECVPVPFTNHVCVQCRDQETSFVEDRHGQLVMDRTDMLGEFGTVPVPEKAAICSAKRKALRSTNRRNEFVTLKLRKLNHTMLLPDCTPNFPKLEKFWVNRTSASEDCCRRESNCVISDFDHKFQQMEEIKPKNLPLLPFNDLTHSKLCRQPMLLEHLSTIANGLGVFSKCVEMQQEFSRTSELIIAMGMCSRFQSRKCMDLQFCFNAERTSFWDTFCHLRTPSKDQSISVKPLARFYGKDQHWPFPSNCTQSVHFVTPVFPVSPPLDLASLLTLFTDGSKAVDQRGVSERTDLSIIPQHSSQDSWMVSQFQASFDKTFWPPASPFRTGRCPCTRSKFGLHTVLALSSPACYRLWTRQRHFGRVPNAQQPFLTQFGEGLKRLIPPTPSENPLLSLPYSLGGVVSWWDPHSPSPCVSTFNIGPWNNCRRSSLGSCPSYLPSYLVAGNGTNLSEAKSLLRLQTNKGIGLQHLSFACVKEPYLALPDPPTSSTECTVSDSTFSSASLPIPSITYVETQLHSEQKEERAPPEKPVSKSKGSLRKVSQIRIRKTVPKQDTNLTPMGLPKPKRLKKKEFSLEEIYTNQNYKSPSAHSKYLETIFEEPVLKKGSFVCTSLQKRKRLLEFQDYTLPRKRRAHAGVKVPSRTRGRKATTRDGESDSLLIQKLTELEAFLAGED
uniref:uncharacterized protein n=1 Tax=Pristiophorus japonicus TaxID=55135 RepID=UPI00398EA32E